MTESAITKAGGGALAPYAERGDVRELSKRLQMMLPGGKKLQEFEALALAQAAVAHGLDPLNGELWYIPGSGLMAGIKGHRRAAHRQMKEEGGGNYWPEFEVIGDDEKAALGIPPDALAYRCKIFDTQTIRRYVDTIERLRKPPIEMPWDMITAATGARPYTPGVGYAQQSESSRMTLVQRAMKRAEADALKRRFDLPFGVGVGRVGDYDTDVIDGEYSMEPAIPPQAMEQALEETNGKAERPLPPVKLRESLHKKVVKKLDDAPKKWSGGITDNQVQLLNSKLNECFAPDKQKEADKKRHSVLGWLWEGRQSAKELTKAEAGAMLDCLLDQSEEKEGTYDLHPSAPREMQAAFKRALKEAGQQEMEL